MQALANDRPALIPISLITGFLGSGKTTLLRELLRAPGMANTAVIINEFGEIGLDHHLLEVVDGETVLIDGGCICCTVRDDLAATLSRLYRQREMEAIPQFQRVVIETTGLADPAPILHMLMKQTQVAEIYLLDSVITTVDAVHGAGQLDSQPESVKQVAVADRIVLTKTDLADGEQLRQLAMRLRRLNPGVPAILGVHGKVDPDALFGAGLYDPHTRAPNVEAWLQAEALRSGQAADALAVPSGHTCTLHGHAADQQCDHPEHAPHQHDADIRSHVLTFDTPLDWDVVSNWLGGLAYFHGDKLLRMKGILNIEDETGPIAVHAVQHLFHAPHTLSAWPDADRRSRLVFITRGLERAVIEAALHSAQAALSPA